MSQTDLGPEGTYLDGLRRGVLLLQRCTASGRHIFYPRAISPDSGAATLEWVEATGRGTVYATTVVARPEKHGGDYSVVLVDLDEGVRMMSQVIGLPPQQLRIGARVQAVCDSAAEPPRVLFTPEGDSA